MIYLYKDFQNLKNLKKEKKLTSTECRKKLRERERKAACELNRKRNKMENMGVKGKTINKDI